LLPEYTYFATGENFPDALAGAAAAAYTYSPIILVDITMDTDILETWRYNRDIMRMKYILGGTGAVPQEVIDSIFK
jgi:hypothetical protein